MDLSNKDVLVKKILDAQDMVRDYEVYSKKVNDSEIAELFKNYAEECGYQAVSLIKILETKYNDCQ